MPVSEPGPRLWPAERALRDRRAVQAPGPQGHGNMVLARPAEGDRSRQPHRGRRLRSYRDPAADPLPTFSDQGAATSRGRARRRCSAPREFIMKGTRTPSTDGPARASTRCVRQARRRPTNRMMDRLRASSGNRVRVRTARDDGGGGVRGRTSTWRPCPAGGENEIAPPRAGLRGETSRFASAEPAAG